jgi:TIR domain-containing protein
VNLKGVPKVLWLPEDIPCDQQPLIESRVHCFDRVWKLEREYDGAELYSNLLPFLSTRSEIKVFLSHNSQDKAFARRLTQDLEQAGLHVWLDEAEMRVGDSLLDRIQVAIDSADYLLVILSAQSVASEWVKREVEIAMTEEIAGRRVKVLPALLEHIELPGFLKGKYYADFTSAERYQSAVRLLVESMRRHQEGTEHDT